MSSTRSVPVPVPAHVDLELVLQAQQQMQLAFMALQQAQGYRGDATLGELAQAWIKAKRPRLASSTVDGYEDSARALAQELARQRSDASSVPTGKLPEAERARLAAEGRRLRLDAIDAGQVERAIDAIAQGRWNSVTCALRAMIKWANKHGFPGVLVLLPELRRHKARPVFYRSGEWARAAHLLHEAYNAAPPVSATTAAAALCAVLWGVRRGAVARLEWAQIKGGELIVQDKGRARIVKIGEVAAEVLAGLPRRGPFVFVGRDDDSAPVHPSSLTTHTRRVLRAGGLSLTLHQAGRHAAGCTIIQHGGSTRDAAAHLGHATTRITEECYVPPVGDTTRARELLEREWSKGGAG